MPGSAPARPTGRSPRSAPAGSARPRLAELIVARAADLAADPGALASLDPGRVAEALDGSLTPAPHRLAIARAIARLRGAPPHAARKPALAAGGRVSVPGTQQRSALGDVDPRASVISVAHRQERDAASSQKPSTLSLVFAAKSKSSGTRLALS